MLEPAISYKYELEELFKEHMYSEDNFWVSGNTAFCAARRPLMR